MLGRILLAIVVFLGVETIDVSAQTLDEPVESRSVDQVTQQYSSPADEEAKPTPDASSEKAGSLSGAGLISMENPKRGFLFSVISGGGWDSNPNESSNSVSSAVYSLSPYVAFHGASQKSQFILQYQPTFLAYPSGAFAAQTQHAALALAEGSVSERLKWKMNFNGSQGQNGARFLAPLQSVPVGVVSGTGASDASFLPNAGSITYALGLAEMSYRKSEHGTIVADLWNSYNRITGSNYGATATARLSYRRDLSPRLSMMGYGQASQYYGNLVCESYGTGASVSWKVRENTLLTAEAGPLINTSRCGSQQGYSYALSYSSRLSGRTQVYLLASRSPSISYIGPGLWQTSASAGMQYRVTTAGLLRVDLEYASSTALAAVSSYRGIAVNATYDVRSRHGFGLSYSYRGFFADSAGSGYSRNLVQISLRWAGLSENTF